MTSYNVGLTLDRQADSTARWHAIAENAPKTGQTPIRWSVHYTSVHPAECGRPVMHKPGADHYEKVPYTPGHPRNCRSCDRKTQKDSPMDKTTKLAPSYTQYLHRLNDGEQIAESLSSITRYVIGTDRNGWNTLPKPAFHALLTQEFICFAKRDNLSNFYEITIAGRAWCAANPQHDDKETPK